MFFKKKKKDEGFLGDDLIEDSEDEVIDNKFKKKSGKVNVKLKKYKPTKSIIKGKKKGKLKGLGREVKPNKWRIK